MRFGFSPPPPRRSRSCRSRSWRSLTSIGRSYLSNKKQSFSKIMYMNGVFQARNLLDNFRLRNAVLKYWETRFYMCWPARGDGSVKGWVVPLWVHSVTWHPSVPQVLQCGDARVVVTSSSSETRREWPASTRGTPIIPKHNKNTYWKIVSISLHWGHFRQT